MTDDPTAFRHAEQALWATVGLDPDEQFLDFPAGGGRIRVQSVGEGSPLVFVHGSPNAGAIWAPLVAHLAAPQLGFRCVLIDRPGCGLSDPLRRDVRPEVLGTELLRAVLDGLGLPRAALVASSLGGALTYQFAEAYPQRVTHLILEGCPAFVDGFRVPPFNLLSSVLGLMCGWTPSSRQTFRHIGHAAAIDRGHFAAAALPWRDALLRHTATARHEDALGMACLRRRHAVRFTATRLARVTSPTLYLWGADDPFGGVGVGEQLRAAQPHATLVSCPQSGHLPWLDRPAVHARLIREFLS